MFLSYLTKTPDPETHMLVVCYDNTFGEACSVGIDESLDDYLDEDDAKIMFGYSVPSDGSGWIFTVLGASVLGDPEQPEKTAAVILWDMFENRNIAKTITKLMVSSTMNIIPEDKQEFVAWTGFDKETALHQINNGKAIN